MINLFKKDATSTATVNKKKEKQEARRQKAQARGEKPIKQNDPVQNSNYGIEISTATKKFE